MGIEAEMPSPARSLSNREVLLGTSFLDPNDLTLLRDLALFRDGLDVEQDRKNLNQFGTVADRGWNLASSMLESKAALLQRCREFARQAGIAIRVASNSWRKKNQDSNAKYACKVLKGQQQLVSGTKQQCPFFINVYGYKGNWKITKMCVVHDHYRNAGFQGEVFVEGQLSDNLERTCSEHQHV
ncbi:hypothetical protein PC118_g22561 [Phytophthora cactorum]|uniref:Uncharacterized protein n=1 Tax=Phytophthora cactorum TaxID=29920 RepID=A0A8T1ESW9_9STRA|nr:hypothetical protein PC118_g22561 [Phytophthora cactorum]